MIKLSHSQNSNKESSLQTFFWVRGHLMEVLLLKQEIETKYQLIELLKDHFKIKLISNIDVTAVNTDNTYFAF